MLTKGLVFTEPRAAALRWLIHPRRKLSPFVAGRLLEDLFSVPSTILLAVVNSLFLNLAALALGGGWIFALLIGLDAVIVTLRLTLAKRMQRKAASKTTTPTDSYMLVCLAWCANQGLIAFAAMHSGIMPLQVLCAMTIFGLVSPICARNYGAPRYAMTFIVLLLAPLVAGALLSGNRWLLLMLLQAPAFLYGAFKVLERFQDLTISILESEEESRGNSLRDFLTGLLNRAGLIEAMSGRDHAANDAFTLFYLDLDGFKSINDQFGHQAGDEVLKKVAARLRAGKRCADTVARLGGDEFVMVAKGMSPAEANRYAEEVIGDVAGEPYAVGGSQSVRVGLSVGFACAPEDGVTREELAPKADAALYDAKAAGKGVHRRFVRRDRLSPHPVMVNLSGEAA